MSRTIAVVSVGLCLAATCMGQTATSRRARRPRTRPAGVRRSPVKKPAPYNPMLERAKFFKAAGVDGELDEKEFAANRASSGGFVRISDRWPAMLRFDKDANKRLDWFEASAFRQAMRTGKLSASRTQGPRAVWGFVNPPARRPSGPTPAAVRGDERPSARREPPRREENADREARRRQWRQRRRLRRFDRNRDGKLDQTEQAAADADERRWRERMQRWELRRYDRNKDGKLDEAEQSARDAGRRRWQDRRRRRSLERFDKNKDGKLNDAEKAARNRSRQEFVKRWDKDGDGTLSGRERRAARQDRQRRRRERRALQRHDANKDGRLDEQERVLKHDFRALKCMPDDGDNYLSSFMFGFVPYARADFLKEGDLVPFDRGECFDDCLDDIEKAKEICRQLGKDFLVVDFTHPDIGFPVVEAIIPGYSDVLPYHPASSPVLFKQWSREDVLDSYGGGGE